MEGFFTKRLVAQRRASHNTVASYRDTFRLLVAFAQQRTGKAPSELEIGDLDADLIGAFLDHLEVERHNSVRTRNNRLAAIRSLFAYAALRHPDHAELIQRVLAIPPKRVDRRLVSFLTKDEVNALLAAPNRNTWVGRRDHALLLVAIQTGLRVSELTALVCADVDLDAGAHLRCHGKGRKERITPLTAQTCDVLRHWLAELQGERDQPLFPSRRHGPLSRDAVALLVAKHARAAAQHCPSLGTKTVTPHLLRHTCAMRLLTAGVDTSVIALWLGHESVETTQIYLHADLTIKERALARTAPPDTRLGRYRVPDPLLAFLEAL
jgi:site-specific recombinase XerD